MPDSSDVAVSSALGGASSLQLLSFVSYSALVQAIFQMFSFGMWVWYWDTGYHQPQAALCLAKAALESSTDCMARLKRASRRCIALVWAMVLVLALAPVISVANGAPAGVFSHFMMHAHAYGDHDHVHHGDDGDHRHGHHCHDGHCHDDGDHHHDDMTDDGPDDSGQGPLHVHYDACCPTMLMPLPTAVVGYRVAYRVVLPLVSARQGAPPGRLLRPPILSL